jgi:hypothetical protein
VGVSILGCPTFLSISDFIRRNDLVTTVAQSANAGRRARSLPAMQVSAYERVARLLLALLLLIGVTVFVLFIVWLGMQIFAAPLKSVPVRIEQVGGGMESGIVGESMQLDSPTPQDVAQESDLIEPEFTETLKTVIDAVAIQQIDIDDPALTDQESENKGGGRQKGTGNRPGYGQGDGLPGIPPHMRWTIEFGEGNTIDTYAKILDYFKIELGTLGFGKVTCASKLAQAKPEVYTKPSKEEQRLYMSWRRGKLKELDRALLSKAGVQPGSVVLQFYPDETEQLLLRAERDFKGRDASTIRKTHFLVRPVTGGYEFSVIDQTYL